MLTGQSEPLSGVLERAAHFDEAVVDSVFAADHFANPCDPEGRWFDGWTVLAALEEQTNPCRVVGSGVRATSQLCVSLEG